MPALPVFRAVLAAIVLACGLPLAAQGATAATQPATAPPGAQPVARDLPPQPRINLTVTVPRGEVNPAQVKECTDRADASTISGEIVVCREITVDNAALTGERAESQKRYAEQTAFKGAPPPPDLFGIPDNGGGISFGRVPPPALLIDVAALPKAPAGSDADRIARGLPPLGQDDTLSEEEEKARREAAGITTTLPPRPERKRRN